MSQHLPVHYLKEDSDFDAEVTHLIPSSERWNKLNGYDVHIDDCFTVIVVSKGSGITDIDFRTVSLSEGQPDYRIVGLSARPSLQMSDTPFPIRS